MKKCLLVILIILMAAVSAQAGNWTQYLGPDGNATSLETGLARSWPEEGPKVLWSFPMVGRGYGGAAASDGMVYVLDREIGKRDILRCIDLATGKEQWTFAYDAPGNLRHAGARTVPAIDGDKIYTAGPYGDIHCIDIKTHKPLWRKNYWKDLGGGKLPMWALAQNPTLLGDLLIVAPQTPEVGVAAYNKKTGEVVWKSKPLSGRPGYVSPKAVEILGANQIVAISSGPSSFRGRSRSQGASGENSSSSSKEKGQVIGINPKNGEILWTYEGWQCECPVANVTPIGDGRLFITGGYQAGSAMIKIEKKEGAFVVNELYTTKEFGTHLHPPVLYQDHLYAHCTTNRGRNDGMVCMDLQGKVKWKTERDPVFDKGGFILADGLILSVDGKEGILNLIEPTPEGFKPISKAQLLGKGELWSPLALIDGHLIIRDEQQVKCVLVR